MSDIAPIAPANADRPDPLSHAAPTRPGADVGRTRPSDRPSDRVELSDRARYLSKMAELPPVRSDLVDAVRRQIARGTYDSTDRLEEAIRNLAEDLELES